MDLPQEGASGTSTHSQHRTVKHPNRQLRLKYSLSFTDLLQQVHQPQLLRVFNDLSLLLHQPTVPVDSWKASSSLSCRALRTNQLV